MSLLRANGGGLGGAGAPGGALGSFYSHTLDQSLKFNDDDSPGLTKTLSGAASSTTLAVISFWIKRSNTGSSAGDTLWASYSSSASRVSGYISFTTSDQIKVYLDKGSGSNELTTTTTAVFRDVSSWYHIVVVYNTADSTTANKSKIYVNGVQQAVSTSVTGSAVTTQELLADGFTNYIGTYFTGSYHFDGYLAEFHVVDGVAGIDHDDFGETKDGIWIPKAYSGGHGNNGYHLPFSVSEGNSVFYDGGDNIRWTDASQFDIGSSDDFCLEFFVKGDFESAYSYGIGDYTNAYFLLQLGPSGAIYGYYSNGGSNTLCDATGILTTTNWHHIAYVRDSGTYRLYIDGVQRGTGTGGGTVANNLARFDVGDAHDNAGAPHFVGALSNLRFTIGDARYGSGTTFTVPTSTLTNDSSSVKLLAFTTSTITADGSTAGISGSITEGNPVFRPDNPFSSIIGEDAAGSNDFISSGLAFTDIVPDSPTNNFATLNPLDNYNTGATLSEGNLKWTIGGADGASRSTHVMTAGKWYVEFLSNNDYIGVVSGNASIINMNGTQTVYYAQDGTKRVNGSSSSYGASYADGSIIGIALDLDASPQTVNFYKNNAAQGSLNLTDVGNEGYSVSCASGSGSTNATANFGQDSSFAGAKTAQGNADSNGVGDFFYSPPSAFLALASSNLPEPAIIDGTEHFNTVLHTGTGSQQAVTGVGFAPDFRWTKSIDTAYAHILHDNVRGETAYLQSNNTSTENTLANMSLDSDGFTAHADDLNDTQVSWLWKAGGAAPKQTYAVTVASDSGQNKYRFDGNTTFAPTLNLQEGGTYTFDQSDSSNSGHPLRFSTTSNGTHGGGSEYTTGVTTTGTPGSAGAKTVITVAASAATLYYYCTQHSGMGGQVNTNATFGSTHLDGSILSTVSANTDAGFSIIAYTGNGSSGQTVAHGLSSAPEFIMHKDRDSNSNNNQWNIYHAGIGDKYGYFLTNAFTGSAQIIPNGTDTIELKSNLVTSNESGDDFIMYAFHSVEGYSKVGSYVGNGSADGAFIFTGFRPAWVMFRSSGVGHWIIFDVARKPSNVNNSRIYANLANDEDSSYSVDFLSNGFKLRHTGSDFNSSGVTYGYLAFAESPFKFANAR